MRKRFQKHFYFPSKDKTLPDKWLSRFDETHLKSLEEHSRAPKTKRDWMVTKKEEDNIIISLRKKNMELGKRKLRRIYFREYGIWISTWKIERVVKYNINMCIVRK